tara:strand:- start:2118 stop:2342 length:225 start_codon:yes stop_codon:yes gene_type:complete
MIMQDSVLEGELAYLPAGALMIQAEGDDRHVSSWVRADGPSTVLVLGKKYGATYFKILYKGATWLARPCDLYPV